MTFEEAWEAMEQGETALYDGKEYYVSMGCLLRPPYGKIALFKKTMLSAEWLKKGESNERNQYEANGLESDW